MSTNPSSLLQKVVIGRAAAGGGSGTGAPERPRGAPVYFELKLIDPSVELEPEDEWGEEIEQPPLQAGSEYRIRAIANSHAQPDQSPIYADAPVVLFVRCKEFQALTTREVTVDKDDLRNLDQEFDLTVPANCPTGEHTLKLGWRYPGDKSRKLQGASLPVVVEGTHPLDDHLLKVCRLDPSVPLPENTAILHIQSDENHNYSFTGWSARDRPLRTKPVEQEVIGLAGFIEAEFEPDEIAGAVTNFSRNNSLDLLEWFKRLYARHNNELCLIVADHSVSELPWEMLKFEESLCIGALWKVVRWIPVRNYTIWQDLRTQKEELSGTVLAYLDAEVKKEAELEALNQFTTSYCENALLLKDSLSKPLDTVAIVYLGCHGIFIADKSHRIAIGGLENPSKNLVALKLEAITKKENPRPLLFVNACHSARVIRKSNGFFGLAAVFLARIANSYLGTLGPVGSTHAARIAERIFAKAAAGTIEPAEILRELRAEAIAKLEANESRENWLNFIYTFMYVFYGNPLVTIKLKAAGEKDK